SGTWRQRRADSVRGCAGAGRLTFPMHSCSRNPDAMTKRLSIAGAIALSFASLGLAACQSGSKSETPSGKSASLRAMEQVAIAAHKCWIASKDPAFKPYQMANELNNFGGTPRFLLVPA